MNIALVAGARPNFMKVAPVHRALTARDGVTVRLVHTGQHHDAELSGSFFQQLELPEPDVNLRAGSGSHAEQTAKVMTAFETWLSTENPDLVMVVGDVNSTLAAALVAAKAGVGLAHIEAANRY